MIRWVVHDILISPGTWRFSAKCKWSMLLSLFFNSCSSMIWWSGLRYVTTWPRPRLANIHAGVNLLQSYAESIFRSDHPPGGGPGHSKPTYQPQSECVTTLHMFKWSLFLVGVRSKNSGVCNIDIPRNYTRERSSSLLFMKKDNSIFSIGGAALCPLYVLRLCAGWHGDTCSQDILLLAPARPPGPCQQPRHGKERWGHLLGQRGAASRYLV